MNAHFFLLSLSFCSLFLLFQQQQHSLSVARFFLNRKNFFCFFSFGLSSSLFFQQQHKDPVHKTLEQINAQIYGIFRLSPSTNMGQSLGGSGDDQL
jgi:hypothetical protein